MGISGVIFQGLESNYLAGGNPIVPRREDKCGVGIQGDSIERLLATWRFPAWKKVETEMSWL